AEFRKGDEADTSALARLRGRLRQLEDSARQYDVSNELDRILTENGAQSLNASTSNDVTNYFFALPANRAKLWFILDSDRIRNPVLREFYSERDVVMEERRLRVETSPGGLLREEFLAAAYRAHPYGRPVVGVASEIQTVSRTARLYQRLVIKGRAATNVFSGSGPGALYPRLFTFTVVPIAPHTTAELEGEIYEEIDRVQREPPSGEELQRVRNQIEASAVQRLENNFGLAFQLSNSEALWYDWRQTFRDQTGLLAVTAADVQRVARAYFDKSNRTVATLVRPAKPATGGT